MEEGIDRREFLLASAAAAALVALPCDTLATSADLKVVGLQVDYLDAPMGLENTRPRLSWRLESTERNVTQMAYRVCVASRKDLLERGQPDLWDSGKVRSRRSLGVKYAGRALESRQCCWWSVQVWHANKAAVSDPSSWEMGLLRPGDWTAQWLAIEDNVARLDRETGLHWIWVQSLIADGHTKKFRFTFQLPVAAVSGEVLAVTNDWYWWTQITRIWIDGKALAGSGVWMNWRDKLASDPAAERLSRQQIPLGSLGAGKHLIAVEVEEIRGTDAERILENVRYVPALALFARLSLENGDTLRVSAGAQCRASVVEHDAWYKLEYDDGGWPSAIPVAIEDYQPWSAQPAMRVRHTFHVTKPVARARLYVTALGAYEARLNGRRVGDALLSPEPSQYAKRVLYQVFDILELLRRGMNAVGFTVADGWYGNFDGHFSWGPPPRRLIAQLEIQYEDGAQQRIDTGPNWSIGQSPVQRSEIKGGETYDARLDEEGWDTAEFDGSLWASALVGPSPPCRMFAQVCSPVRAKRAFKPASIVQPKRGIYVADFMENFSGWCRISVKGYRGQRIELKFAERLNDDGLADRISRVIDPYVRRISDVYILRGDPQGEVFEPSFSYRGFRYVEIHGLEEELSLDSIEGVFIHSDLKPTGHFRCDSRLIETIWRNSVQTYRSNFVGITTDNCTREWRGWVEQTSWDAATFAMDTCAFMSRQMDNLVDDQGAGQPLPALAPVPIHGNALFHVEGTPPSWGDAGIQLCWMAWRRYGDLAIVRRNWHAMDRHLQFILENNPTFLWANMRGQDFGDWAAPRPIAHEPPLLDLSSAPQTDKELFATAYWAHSASQLAQMAEVLGRTQDAERLQTVFARVRDAFNAAFVRPNGVVGNGSQTSCILALAFDLLPAEVRTQTIEWLSNDIRRRGRALTTGIRGTQFSLDVLAEGGFAELAYDILLRDEYPSWGFMIKNGATTLWEFWDDSGARNQVALGSVCGFLLRRIAGIDAATPGFESITIRPIHDTRLKRAGGDYDSIMGRISTDWMQGPDGGFSLHVTIPANASAHVHLPAGRTSVIEESGMDVSLRRDLHGVSRLDREAVVAVGSGTYSFVVKGGNSVAS